MQISIKGIDHAIKTAEKYANIDNLLRLFTAELVTVGQFEAANTYGTRVSSRLTDYGGIIEINGDDVLFIEFGTGDAAGIHAAQYDAVPSVVRPGSWSETHAHQYEMLGFWWWHNTKFTETAPHPGAYDAYRAMVEAIPRIAREVFAK